jgi:endonuclease YncB( thermonuclease family)
MRLAQALRNPTLLALVALAPLVGGAPHLSAPVAGIAPAADAKVPAELFEVVKIVDGDTIHIMRAGQKEKLRLLSVDTEEKLTPGQRSSSSKPQTVFGEDTRLWTIDYFEQFRDDKGLLRVGLSFPGGKEARDIYGRLLCHVVAEDGTDFNLLLVQLGKSPYFNKYGNSLICHKEFVAAQTQARRNLIGIWDPRTNQPADGDSPSAKRPYDQLLPWWQMRADAIDSFRSASAKNPASVIAADDADGLARALASKSEVRIFGSPDRFFDEKDGSRTVLFRAEDKQRALRVSIAKDALASFEAFDVNGLRDEYRQNYVYVTGVITQGERGFRIDGATVANWARAGADSGK